MYIKNVVVCKDKSVARKFLKDQEVPSRNKIAIVDSLIGLQGFNAKRTRFIIIGKLPNSMYGIIKDYGRRGSEVRKVDYE